MELAAVLARHRKAPLQDVVPPLRRCGGIVSETDDEAAALSDAAALSAAGFPARALASAALAALPPAHEARSLELGPSSPLAGRLSLIAAAGITQTSSKLVKTEEGPGPGEKAARIGLTLVTGIPLGGGSKKEVIKKVESTDLLFFVDLLLEGPSERMRVDAARFDFSCLGAAMGFGALENLRRLLAALAALRPQARLNRGARILLENKPVREMGYESLADLEREQRWRLTLGV
jgi:hypothetical protein